MTAQWYTLQSKPMKEAFLGEQLNLHQIESYFPCIHVRSVTARAQKVKPYFPGYVFGHLDSDQYDFSMFQRLPGATGVVSFGGIPSTIPDSLIAAIRWRVDQINGTRGEQASRLRPGDVVSIQDGPFRGYDAIFDSCVSGDERARVLLQILNRRQIPLEIPVGQIRRRNH